MVTAKLSDGQILELEFGKWQGHEADIVELDCNYQADINNLVSISELQNLKSLQMRATYTKDLSSISNLNKLESLQLGINNIKDLTRFPNLLI